MVNALFDTNILIDYLGGVEAARDELARYESRAISVVTWMEVLVGATASDDAAIRTWLSSFDIIPLDGAVANRAVAIRQARRIRLPDAIVWASAQVNGLLLVSRNTKDFPVTEPGIRAPYQL
ncbi:type II toxin-antitoxin system VapC family toxin [Burkholderia vietnamiensis]|jgi:predicted nucleic acid-binding protein|uniref:type II toxin-antitoxin system VapC family toxin n=1 Tax=Burkholderia vietnamiensis TaxID=60552 RepID=UPI00075F1158|nr:type II toxin-antitoxin system VapC family toxin [Burkholderia vietnamiensis]TPQ45292.1 PIN domain-containing protein [Burkholderia ubonensis]AOK43202.1 twitching motility protein PilT [Burkholderia vietnamiensis]KVE51376.1 twitching motility protein PilT [Burkholderia vietnamiensis]KVE71045.1 twitching motility protein PilT [Burkholderia vietnamiensis]KVE83428.1 twitching motility protein PilT [Burkholderia vietnamiensis]